MKAVEFNGIGVRHPLINRRIPTFKEWLVRRGHTEAVDHFFWALKDITFDLEQGETLGVIGSNGAGKSTLLRVAAGIITPSSGEAIIRGSLAPLIELGTGFDAELSGRENIFFNAALLGRSRSEVRRKVDEIVDFAGLDEFIDAPLRTYSTGMVARLAFSIATTIDPDVLLLDEILSVGDAAFKKKSRERIKSFWKRGTTIMLVSHELHTVKEICAKAAWIEHGQIRAFGPSADVIKEYTEAVGVVMETRETVEV
jgi:ABC-type polysaccharide/polyol phosphate transport system ATPase subunit